jgi:hypothetical protein
VHPGVPLEQWSVPADLDTEFGIVAGIGTLHTAVSGEWIQARILSEKSEQRGAIGNHVSDRNENTIPALRQSTPLWNWDLA